MQPAKMDTASQSPLGCSGKHIHLKEGESHFRKLFFTEQGKVPKGGVSHTDLVQEASLSPLLLLDSEADQVYF